MAKAEDPRSFVYHAPKGDQAQRYGRITEAAKDFAKVVEEVAPASEERSLALRRVQEARMWANAAIAINEAE
jgi:hypothetical protein